MSDIAAAQTAETLPKLPVYVIHATFMTERRASIAEQLGRAGLAFEFVLGNDPGAFDPEMVQTYIHPDSRQPVSVRSCFLKHLAAYETIRARQQEEALILEDDVLLEADFTDRLEAVRHEARGLPALRSLQLGAANNRYTPADQLRPGRLLYPAEKVRAGEAYLIGWREAELYLRALAAEPTRYPIDLILNKLNPRLGITVYWAEPPLLFQGSMTGRFRSGIEHAPRHRNRLYNTIKFSVNRVRKYHLRRLLGRLRPSRGREERREGG
jgi:glycosyl transferase family 25